MSEQWETKEEWSDGSDSDYQVYRATFNVPNRLIAGGGSGGTTPTDGPGSLQHKLSAYVYRHLQLMESRPLGPLQTLEFDEAEVQCTREIDPLEVFGLATRAYQGTSIQDLQQASGAATSQFNDELSPTRRSRLWNPLTLQEQLANFEGTFEGDADNVFREYIAKCCAEYKLHRVNYAFPCVTLAQSSGFGKSRLLYSLATSAETNVTIGDADDIMEDPYTVEMRVLYVSNTTPGFPLPTPQLWEWIFEGGYDKRLTMSRLIAIRDYAFEKWGSVGTQWLQLFSDPDSDAAVKNELEKFQEAHAVPHPAQKKASAETSKVVVLAIDSASTLVDRRNIHGETYFELLQQALGMIGTEDIFAVVVDALPQLGESALSLENKTLPGKKFLPFVLNQTMDIMINSNTSTPAFASYKASVCEPDPRLRMRDLMLMGRPLWDVYYNTLKDPERIITQCAASRLLLGEDPSDPLGYSARNLHGMAALLCRLGLRPHFSSRLASRAVADFMSVLYYVNHSNDAYISSYISEPVLALASMSIWHQLESKALEDHMLPQFTELLMQGEIDIGGIGEVVAQIFLLLAADHTAMERKSASGFKFDGDFFPVLAFLESLSGVNPQVERVSGHKKDNSNGKEEEREEVNTNEAEGKCSDGEEDKKRTSKEEEKKGTQNSKLKQLKERWDGWRMSFTHFVDLSKQPTQETLWFLLSRRAAGVLPRNQAGADLMIPIFNGSNVSMILVQVKNRVSKDRAYPDSATTKLHPKNVFGDQQELGKLSTKDIIRVYISLREKMKPDDIQKYIYQKRWLGSPRFSLCIRGILQPGTAAFQRWPFLSDAKLTLLRFIANSGYWDPRDFVEDDLAKHPNDPDSVLNDKDISAIPKRLLDFVP